MRPYLTAAIQMNSLPSLEQNLSQAERLIELAVNQGAELIALPENFSFLGDKKKTCPVRNNFTGKRKVH